MSILEEASANYDSPNLNTSEERIRSLLKISEYQQKTISELIRSPRSSHKRTKSGASEAEFSSLLLRLDDQFKRLLTENESLKSQIEALKKENELLRILKLDSPKEEDRK